MSISVQCPSCEKKLKAKDELAGKRVKCPNCAQLVVVPSVCSAPLQPTPPNPSPRKSPPRSGHEATASPAPQSRPVRWPWYAGGGAAFLCVLAIVISIFAMPGKDRTTAKNEMAVVTPPESKPEPKPERKAEPKPEPEPKPPEEKPEKLLAVTSKDWKKDFGAFIDVLSPVFKRDPLHSELKEKFEGQQVIWTGQFTQISFNGKSKVVWLKMPAKTVTLSNGAKAEVYTLWLVPKENNLKKWEDAKVGDTVRFKTTLKGDSNSPAVNVGQFLDGVNAGKYHILIMTDDAELVQAELPNAKAEAATINAESAKAKAEMAKADLTKPKPDPNDVAKFIQQGGKFWSSPTKASRGDTSFAPGDRFWVWPVEDRVFEAEDGKLPIKFHWRVRPGQKPSQEKNDPVFANIDFLSEGGGATNINFQGHRLELKTGASEGIFELTFDVKNFSGEGGVLFFLNSALFSEKTDSNLLLLKVKFTK